MQGNIVKKTLSISGMTCTSCESRIQRKLLGVKGITGAEVSFATHQAIVSYDESVIKLDEIIGSIRQLDYEAAELMPGNGGKTSSTKIAGAALMIFAAYFLISRFGGFKLINSFPLAKQGMGYGMLFVIGLLTSVHCIAMCGGINISQSLQAASGSSDKDVKFSTLKPTLLYNSGRVISYTVIGAIVGGIGSVVSFSGAARGIVQLAAGVFMVIMGLNMLNLFPFLSRLNPRMPKSLANSIDKQRNGKGPLIVGLLNGLMPCGPLQAMQLYALSTGSIVGGALSMLVFSLGTVPLMFGLGALSSVLNRKFTRKMVTVSAVMVVLLGIIMFGNGLNLSGFSTPSLAADKPVGSIAKISNGIQIVTTKLSANSYEPIVVQKGIPVRWIIQADKANINGCNNRIIIPKYNKEKKLEPGDNIIEFTPLESGVIPFSCWMGMIKSKITVVDELGTTGPAVAPEAIVEKNPPATDDASPLNVPACCN